MTLPPITHIFQFDPTNMPRPGERVEPPLWNWSPRNGTIGGHGYDPGPLAEQVVREVRRQTTRHTLLCPPHLEYFLRLLIRAAAPDRSLWTLEASSLVPDDRLFVIPQIDLAGLHWPAQQWAPIMQRTYEWVPVVSDPLRFVGGVW